MLVDLGRVCLSRRRMQAAGGSKSCVVVLLLFDAADLMPAGAAALEDSTAAWTLYIIISDRFSGDRRRSRC